MSKPTTAKKSNNPLRASINKNFIIRWRKPGEKQWRLVSAGRYAAVVGVDYCTKHFDKVLEETEQNFTFKIRHGIETMFVAK